MKCGDLVQYYSMDDASSVSFGVVVETTNNAVRIYWSRCHWSHTGAVSGWLPARNCKILSKIP